MAAIPAPLLVEKNKRPVPPVSTPLPPPLPRTEWQQGFLEKKVQSLFKRFRYVVITEPKSSHYKSLCKIYPEHLEEKVDTPQGPRIIFIVEKADVVEKKVDSD